MDRSNPPDFSSPDVNRSCAAMPDRSHCQSDANVSFASHPPPSNLMTDDSSNMVKPSSESDDANESCSYRSNGSSVGDSSPSDEPQELCTNGDPSSPKRSKNGKRKRDRSKLRKGKWTSEEEDYTSRIIHYFSTGLLTLPEGSTLRSYLADKLNCDPMRITKKYAGASCLGRRVYHFRDRVHPSIAEIQVAKVELDHLEQRFRLRVEGGHSSTTIASTAVEQPPLASATANAVLPTPSVQGPENLLQNLLLGLTALQQNAALQIPPQQASIPPPPVPAPFANPMAPSAAVPAIPPVLAQLLLASAAGCGNTFGAVQNPVPLNNTTQAPAGVDPNVANWAFTQVAAALGPALSQLAAANMKQLQQQQQLQAQQQQAEQLLVQQKAQLQSRIQEQQSIIQQKLLQLQNQGQGAMLPAPEQLSQGQGLLPSPLMQPMQDHVQKLLPPQPERTSHSNGYRPQPEQVSEDKGQRSLQLEQMPHSPRQVETKVQSHLEPFSPSRTIQEEKSKFFAAEFKQAYERHLMSLGIETAPDVNDTKIASSNQRNEPVPMVNMPVSESLSQANVQRLPESVEANEFRRTEEDEEGGTALLGFLSSLRKSYENVLRDKQISESSKSEVSYNMTRAATVTDSNSSQQRDSSVEDSDWNSDKKTDNSSSEDSEKEEGSDEKVKNAGIYHNQGPPRKRMKVKRVADVIRKGPSS